MKKMFAFVFAFATLGCSGQLPPSPNPTVNLTWTAPVSCTGGALCTFVISRATVTSGACPATSGTAYTPLNQASPASGTTYTDQTPTAGVCYTAQTVQHTLVSVASSASNSGVPLAVAVVPLAPGAPNATTLAGIDKPAVTQEYRTETASIGAPVGIRATVRR